MAAAPAGIPSTVVGPGDAAQAAGGGGAERRPATVAGPAQTAVVADKPPAVRHATQHASMCARTVRAHMYRVLDNFHQELGPSLISVGSP